MLSPLLLAAGSGVAAGLWRLARRRDADPLPVLRLGLLALALAAPVWWIAASGPGMSWGDVYVSGGTLLDPWTWPFCAVSAAAVPALVVATVVVLRTPRTDAGR